MTEDASKNIVKTFGKAFLEASELLEQEDRADPELVQTVSRIALLYAQPLAASNRMESSQSEIALPEILIPKETPLRELKKAMQAHEAAAKFPLGTIIPDTWRDEFGCVHDNPLIIMQYRLQTCTDGKEHYGVELARRYVLDNAMPFSADGNNLYSKSEINRWLNSKAECYMDGCTDELCEILIDQEEIRLMTPIGEKRKKTVYDVCDCYAYLPTGANLYSYWGVHQEGAIVDGEVWAYYRNNKPGFYTADGKQYVCWLRSAYKGTKNKVWIVCADGCAHNTVLYKDLHYNCAPICHFIHL